MEFVLSISEAMIPRANEGCRRIYNDGILVPRRLWGSWNITCVKTKKFNGLSCGIDSAMSSAWFMLLLSV